MEFNKLTNISTNEFSNETIEIKPYLEYAQVQQIADAVCKFDGWAMRQTNYDMLLLYHATNIPKEELENHSHEDFLDCGLIDYVKQNVRNIGQIDEAIKQNESIMNSLNKLLKKLTEAVGPIMKVVEKNAKTTSKK